MIGWRSGCHFSHKEVLLCPHRHHESKDELCQNYILQYV